MMRGTMNNHFSYSKEDRSGREGFIDLGCLDDLAEKLIGEEGSKREI